MGDIVKDISLIGHISPRHVDTGSLTLVIGIGPQTNDLVLAAFQVIAFTAVTCSINSGNRGTHMVIHYNAKEDYFWILYAIAGVGIPLGWTWCYHKLKPVLDGYINR